MTLSEEIRRLIAVKHQHLQGVYAVKLAVYNANQNSSLLVPTFPRTGSESINEDRWHTPGGGQSGAYMRLCVLVERSPQLTLEDVLAQCDYLKKDRAIVGLSD